ncbi:MAG TPA: DUF3857 and transglutaminase domain-containing protein, partial [Puia sp.]|nr:DUF3857 and transglutaminase domain-containing protein [Puia sp.]
MKRIFIICCILSAVKTYAQDFSALFISDSLRKNANVVKRYEEKIIEVKSPGKAVVKERHVYTVLNEEAQRYGSYTTFYSKFTNINSVSGTLYDAMGKKQKHIRKSDMEDRSYFDGFSLMNDARYKTTDFYCRNYPYTVDYEEEDDENGIMSFESWFPVNSSGMSVENSKYTIIVPKDYVIRYKNINCSIQPVITETKDTRIYTWEIKNVPAKYTESFGPSWSEIAPRVLIGPSDFEVEGYKGNMSTWNNYGKFIHELEKGRDVLPDDIKRKVHDMTDNLKDEKQKIRVLYDFMQKNTHYISIQLGIGGWQPFDATYVATKRYGDCKALSNYMVALLKEAGIKGNTVDIRAGADAANIINDFPSFQFNHEIACVPMDKDTVWLECTSQTLPAGYLSDFTADRYAILKDENGGKLVHTPKYGLSDNVEIRKISSTINDEGNLSAAVNTQYKAERQDHLEQMINYLSQEEQLKHLKSTFNLPTYDVMKFNYAQQKDVLPPSINESLDLAVTNYAQVSGRRIFITPNILTRSATRLKQETERKYDVVLKDEYKIIDSVEIKIPAGFQPEAIPQDMKLETKFGKYISSVKVMPDKILYYREQEQFSGRFPPSDYASLTKFYDDIYKADRSKVV